METTSQLKFNERMTVEQFKSNKGTASLHIKRSPKTDKLFMTDAAGNVIGAVSEKSVDASNRDNLVVSNVTSPDSGETFFLLHPKGQGAEDELTL